MTIKRGKKDARFSFAFIHHEKEAPEKWTGRCERFLKKVLVKKKKKW
jgi:hypothetical protein